MLMQLCVFHRAARNKRVDKGNLMKKTLIFLILSVLITSLAACQMPGGISEPTLPPLFPAATETAPLPTIPPPDTATPTALPTAISTATQTPTSTPLAPVSGVISVASMNLRTGPSTLHNIVGKYIEGSPVSVVGQAPGGEWLKVEMEDNRFGWMAGIFLDLDGDTSGLPILSVSGSIIFEGRVIDSAGEPVDGISVAAYRTGSDGSERAEGSSGTNGHFYLYVPEDAGSDWSASVVGVDCRSRIMDTACSYNGRFEPESLSLTLVPEGAVFEFQYIAE